MGKRFGRGQKQKLKSEIEQLWEYNRRLGLLLEGARSAIRMHENAANRAKEEAFAQFCADQKLIERAIHEITDRLARTYGPELMSAASKLMHHQNNRRPMLDLVCPQRNDDPMTATAHVIRGTIPALSYQVVVTKMEG